MTTPSPAFDCPKCHRRIGKKRTHYLIKTTGEVWCPSCTYPFTGSIPTHAIAHPDCPTKWHDMWDHSSDHLSGTRAGIAWHLGLSGRHKQDVTA